MCKPQLLLLQCLLVVPVETLGRRSAAFGVLSVFPPPGTLDAGGAPVRMESLPLGR